MFHFYFEIKYDKVLTFNIFQLWNKLLPLISTGGAYQRKHGNEGKCVIAGRFIRNLKNRIYKYITSVVKNVYIDKLDEIVCKI